MKEKLLLSIQLVLIVAVYGWQSSNEGNLYHMDDLCSLSDSICFNDTTSQYEVRCDIVIMESDTLKINAGEIVKFCELHLPQNTIFYGIKIYGNLNALGEEDNQIILGDPESVGENWNGIKFYNTSSNGESLLKYCKITSAQDIIAITAIYCENSSPLIDHCLIRRMYSGMDSAGGSGVYCAGQSYPIISYCSFEDLHSCIAVWCGNPWIESLGVGNWWDEGGWGWQDTLSYPNPQLISCNIMPSVEGFWDWFWNCVYDKVILHGGFLNNCYLGINELDADMTLGFPSDTVGDGICTTNSTNWDPRYWLIDGVVNPRSTPEWTDVDEEEINISPTTSEYIVLEQNYPNPFNPETTIDFTLNHKSKVNLTIYNSKGQKIRLLYEGVKEKGTHSICWDGRDDNSKKVTSGIYFYKLVSNDQMQIKKAILVK